MDEETEETEIQLDDDYKAEDYNPRTYFVEAEEEFVQIGEVLARNDRLGHLSQDYGRLLDSWRAAFKREIYFVEETKTLRASLNECKEKIANNVKQLREDDDTIEKLKLEITEALKMTDAAHTREQVTQDLLDGLQVQVNKLSQELELNKKLGGEQEHEAGSLAKNKEVLQKEKDRLMAELLVAKGKISKGNKMLREQEEKLVEADAKMTRLNTELESLRNDLLKEKRFKDMLNEDLVNIREVISTRNMEIINLQAATLNQSKHIQALEQTIKDQKLHADKATKEIQDLTASQKSLMSDLNQQQNCAAKMAAELDKKIKSLKLKEEECARLKLDEQKLIKTKETLHKKLALFDQQKAFVLEEKNKLATTIGNLEKERDDLKKTIHSDKKLVEAVLKEKDMVAKAAQKMTDNQKELKAQITLQVIQIKRLEGDVAAISMQMDKDQSETKRLNAERDSLISELSQIKSKFEEKVQHMKLLEQSLSEQKKLVEDGETKLKMQISMFEQVRSERNKVSKNYVEALDEIKQLNQKLKVKGHEVEQLKEDIASKETMIIKGEFTLQKVIKEKESLKLEKQKLCAEIKELRDIQQHATLEERRLIKKLEESVEEKNKLTHEINQLYNDRDNVTSQLGRKVEEVNLLYEKVGLLEDTLKTGEAQYQQRIEDIKLLKVEIKRLRQEKAFLGKHLGNAANLRKEMLHLERKFTKERMKSRAMEEEMANPLNIHRWRRLEGTDPSSYELVQKVRLLQKRLITAREEAVVKDNQLAELEEQYEVLYRCQTAKPEEELAEKLQQTKLELREKSDRVKVLTAELSMFKSQISEYKLNLQHRTKELTEFKKKYHELKKTAGSVLEDSDRDDDKISLPYIYKEPSMGSLSSKFLGGGYSISASVEKVGQALSLSTQSEII